MTPQAAVQNLIDAGRSEIWIAYHLGIAQSTVWRIRNGQETKWELGQKIVALAEKECPAAAA
jgi:DNA invertase Pin-like site-specific DNA recombinase